MFVWILSANTYFQLDFFKFYSPELIQSEAIKWCEEVLDFQNLTRLGLWITRILFSFYNFRFLQFSNISIADFLEIFHF